MKFKRKKGLRRNRKKTSKKNSGSYYKWLTQGVKKDTLYGKRQVSLRKFLFKLWLETHYCQCCRIHLMSARDIN